MAALTTSEHSRAGFEWTPQQFQSFYDRHHTIVFHTVREVVRARDVDDVVQETFIRLFRKRHTFRGETSLAGWVRTVARNSALMHLRLARVRYEKNVGDETVAFLVDEHREHLHPDDHVDAKAALEKVRSALPRMREDQRRLLEMRGEERSMREIAEEFDVSVACAKSRLYRARQELRELLPPRLIEL